MTEFNQWKETIDNIKSWDIKYYKGLGTSTSEEAKEYFTNITEIQIKYKKDAQIKHWIKDAKISDDAKFEVNDLENYDIIKI